MEAEKHTEKNVTARIAATTALAIRLAQHSEGATAPTEQRKHKLLQHCKVKTTVPTDTMEADMDVTSRSVVDMEQHNWSEAYALWHAATYDRDANKGIVPNKKQQQVLDMVHARCVDEKSQQEDISSKPLLRLVHGLPGSGKSQLLKWLRSYFIAVWHWVEGREFVFVAPLNAMAIRWNILVRQKLSC